MTGRGAERSLDALDEGNRAASPMTMPSSHASLPCQMGRPTRPGPRSPLISPSRCSCSTSLSSSWESCTSDRSHA